MSKIPRKMNAMPIGLPRFAECRPMQQGVGVCATCASKVEQVAHIESDAERYGARYAVLGVPDEALCIIVGPCGHSSVDVRQGSPVYLWFAEQGAAS